MFVMSIGSFLERYGTGGRKLESHGALRRQGLVCEWDRTSEVLFISHEWTSVAHPDPDGQQTAELCTFLERLRSGIVDVDLSREHELIKQCKSGPGKVTAVRGREWRRRLTAAHIWMDYISAPQPRAPHCGEPSRPQQCEMSSQMEELNAAIASIPAYIAQCSIFVAFAPTCVTRQTSSRTVATSYVTWRRRGWTRFEFLLAKLSAVPKISLVVRSGSVAPVFDPPPSTGSNCVPVRANSRVAGLTTG